MKIEALFTPYQTTGPNSVNQASRAKGVESSVSILDRAGNDGQRRELLGKEPERSSVAPERVERAVKQINDYLQIVQRNLQFSVDKDTKQIVIKVIDAATGEVVRQIPPEAVLEMARNMKENHGLLFAQQA